MTYTEAAVEVLRRAGKPLHFKDIAEVALKENLLSHVGQDPEVTMGQRLAAMAKREEERKVVAIAPEGTFALHEWGVPAEAVVEPVAPPLSPPETGEPLYRPREREPRAIHAQARKRLAELQAEHEDGHEEVEAERRKQDQKRGGQRRFPPPAEVIFEALAQKQSGAPLAELATQLLEKQLLSEGLVQDLPSLVAALLEDNRRRTEAGRKPAFIVDGERVTLVEFPAPSAIPEEIKAPHGAARPMSATQLVAEGRRATVRALRRRLTELDTNAFEQLCAQLLEKMGMRDVRVAKRSKEGPLYLARQRRGLSDLRVAVKLVRGSREIGRQDVQELRKDLAHYSAQMGLVLAPGDAARDARGEASAAGQAPVALYAGEALPEELIAMRVGVSVAMVEVPEVDEAFFAGLSRRDDRRPRIPEDREEPRENGRAAQQPQPAEPAAEQQPRGTYISGMQDETAASPSLQGEGASEAPQGTASDAAPPAAPEAAPEAPAAPPAEPPAADEAAQRERRPRGGRGGREDRPRASGPAEQAWGQPAGTLRFTAPAGPTVATAPQEPAAAPTQEAAAEPAPAAEPPPEAPKSDEPS